jgi:hypothetical protein
MPHAQNLRHIGINLIINVKNIVFKAQELPFYAIGSTAVENRNVLAFYFVKKFRAVELGGALGGSPFEIFIFAFCNGNNRCFNR